MAATRSRRPRTSQQVQRVRSARRAAKDSTRQVAKQVESTADAAKQLMSEALRDEVRRRVTAAAAQVGVFAEAARSAGEHLAEEGQEGAADWIRQAADRLEELESYLDGKDPETILSDLEDLARRNPWLLGLAGAFVGLATSRFVKASARGLSSR